MRNCVLIAAMAGMALAAASAMPARTNAMTISTPAGLLTAAADINQTEPVWCSWRGCWPGPVWGPRPYWGPGFYRPYGFYGPGLGWGWRRRWW
jgi:hypothetical protein